jgi:hypothetical protein
MEGSHQHKIAFLAQVLGYPMMAVRFGKVAEDPRHGREDKVTQGLVGGSIDSTPFL